MNALLLPVRRLMLSLLRSSPTTYAVGAAFLWLTLVGLIFIPVLFGPGGAPPQAPAAGPITDSAVMDTPGIRALIATTALFHAPVAPVFAPPQAAEAPLAGRLLGLRPDQRPGFEKARRLLLADAGACRGALGPTRGQRPADIDEAKAALDEAVQPRDKARAFIYYHYGLVYLCEGQFTPAADEETAAVKAFGGDGWDRTANRAKAQYRMAAQYALGLAHLGEGGAAGAQKAHEAFAGALAEVRKARTYAGGGIAEFRASAGDLFDFSSAEILSGLIASDLALGNARAAADEPGVSAVSPDQALLHADLAANLALAYTNVREPLHPGATDPLAWISALAVVLPSVETSAGADTPRDGSLPAANWTTDHPAEMLRILAAAATTTVPLHPVETAGLWPQGGVEDEAVRSPFTASSGFPTLPVSDVATSATDQQEIQAIDEWLWIRTYAARLEALSFKDLDDLKAEQRRLQDPEARASIGSIETGMKDNLGRRLEADARRLWKTGGESAARPLLRLLARGGFSGGVTSDARLALAHHRPPGWGHDILDLATWPLLVLLAILVVNEWRIGYRRTFTDRHYRQRLDALKRAPAPLPAAHAPPAPT